MQSPCKNDCFISFVHLVCLLNQPKIKMVHREFHRPECFPSSEVIFCHRAFACPYNNFGGVALSLILVYPFFLYAIFLLQITAHLFLNTDWQFQLVFCRKQVDAILFVL